MLIKYWSFDATILWTNGHCKHNININVFVYNDTKTDRQRSEFIHTFKNTANDKMIFYP